jgi:branched-chain amino acid transport system permease protein
MLAYALIAGVLTGLFYALSSLGLNLAFGVLRVVNIAHGDIVVLGAYLTYELSSRAHLGPLVSMAIAAPAAVAIGAVVYLAIAPSLRRATDPEMLSLILFFGLSQVIEAVQTISFTNNQQTLSGGALFGGSSDLLGQSLPRYYLTGALASLPILLGVFLYLYRSRAGLATRALMSSREDARAVGIDPRRTCALAFGLSLALAAVAGSLAIFLYGGVNPSLGADITTTAFAVIVLGGLGSPLGTVAGGLIYGVAYELAQSYEPNWADLLPYVLLLAVMLLRPSGIAGGRARYA